MTETLYISPGIPNSYHYIRYGNGYYDLYNQASMPGDNYYTFYRVYYSFNQDMFEKLSTHVAQYNTLYAQNVNVSNSVWYRKDLDSILTVCFIICFFAIMVINIFSSIFKKGGVLSGLF